MPMITVPLGQRTYPIHIGNGLLDCLGAHVLEALGEISVAVVTDDNVAPLYLDRAVKSLESAGLRVCTITLPHGEATKCLDQLANLYTFLCENRITRKDAVVALGGGVIGDLTGLAAATFLRGTHFIQVPTTLLAQVDSSVGGKVAVDIPAGKNLVGAFYQPKRVIIDPDTLSTLPQRQLACGLGEMIKHGAIFSRDLWDEMARMPVAELLDRADHLVIENCRIKTHYVEADPLDKGLRFTLNFGHTLGHALEKHLGYGV